MEFAKKRERSRVMDLIRWIIEPSYVLWRPDSAVLQDFIMRLNLFLIFFKVTCEFYQKFQKLFTFLHLCIDEWYRIFCLECLLCDDFWPCCIWKNYKLFIGVFCFLLFNSMRSLHFFHCRCLLNIKFLHLLVGVCQVVSWFRQ